MLEYPLDPQLSHVARRIRRLWMWQQLMRAWIVLSLLVIAWAGLGRPFISVSGWGWLAGLIAAMVWIRSQFLAMPHAEVARRIERAFPDLKARLLAALEQSPDVETGRLNVLQRQVVSEAMHHSRMNDWSTAVPRRQMTRAFFSQLIALASLVLIGAIAVQWNSNSAIATSKALPSENVTGTEIPVTVEPGNVALERGSSLLVMARFTSNSPADVQVIWKNGAGAEHRQSLVKSLDDPVFATRLPTVNEDLTYHVDYDGKRSVDFAVTVYDLPTLIRSDLTLKYPEYTNLKESKLEDAFETSVVEGTQVGITCKVNKPLVTARLTDESNTAFELKPNSSDPTTYHFEFIPQKRMRLKLELIDESGRKNRDPEEFRIDVVPNRAPELTLIFPGKDVKVSPLEEVQIEATAIDDFGVIETGLVFQVAGRDPVRFSLGQNLLPGALHKFTSLQRLEDYRVQPDELVSYYLFAIDFGPDGQKRETSSDVFFAEVRSFDEIYRQLDQQSPIDIESPQKPPENLAKLIELQRQIVVSTWKIARLPKPTWSPKLAEELKTVLESQQQAMQKLGLIRELMTQPQLQPIFATISEAMEAAQKKLTQSLTENSFEPLRPAVFAEQNAYQGLLKLRAKEHFLKQAKGNGTGQDNEEKPDLELKRTENRYESEKAGAKKEESNINKEALAILDRLKDLARRQEGINQQLKELEAQMRQAKTDEDRTEIERQLKRLREEQQLLLHDADELRNKLNQSARQETLVETKNQLEQTRQRLVDTAEKLREGQTSQALNSGTRAERELKQLQDDFRKQTAAQFADSMRSLREEARQLAERENQLAQQLAHMRDESRHTLRQSQERAALQSEFQQQRRQIGEIVERAKQVVEQSETPEPLLSKQLYDTLRSARDAKLDQAINATNQLLKQGIIPEAIKAEQQARVGIDRLKQGIEKAAESVLGNEVDSMKRARKQLAELSEELEKEIQANTSRGNANSQNKLRDGQSNPANSEAGKDANSANPDSASASNSQGSPGDSKQPGASGQPNANAEGRGTDGAADGSSDATVPTNAKPTDKDAGPERKGLGSLRGSKATGKGSTTGGRESSDNDSASTGGSAGNSQGGGPLTGGDFSGFNERLRDVESMVSDPQLQNEVQKVRDRARGIRVEFKRHTNNPNWELVRTSVHQPMLELQQRLADEIAKRESPDSLVPVDRDPVPTRYRDLVRNYYERLGAGKEE